MAEATASRLYRKRHRERPLRGAVGVLETGNQPFSMLLLQHLKLYADARFRYARWHLGAGHGPHGRSEEHTSELQSLMRISYAVFCLKKKKKQNTKQQIYTPHNL